MASSLVERTGQVLKSGFLIGSLISSIACTTYQGGIVMPRQSSLAQRAESLQQLRWDFNAACDKYKVTMEEFYCLINRSASTKHGRMDLDDVLDGRFDNVIEVRMERRLGFLDYITVLYRDGSSQEMQAGDQERANRIIYNILYLSSNR